MMPATVTLASPLRVRIDGATTDSPARVLARADSYAPALDARVLVEQVGSRVYVIGSA